MSTWMHRSLTCMSQIETCALPTPPSPPPCYNGLLSMACFQWLAYNGSHSMACVQWRAFNGLLAMDLTCAAAALDAAFTNATFCGRLTMVRIQWLAFSDVPPLPSTSSSSTPTPQAALPPSPWPTPSSPSPTPSSPPLPYNVVVIMS